MKGREFKPPAARAVFRIGRSHYIRSMAETAESPALANLLAELERKYFWWRPVAGTRHAPARIIAQAMDLGTYDDIRRMEEALGPEALGEVARAAAPGWLSERSWEFWRGRLSAAGVKIAERPPRRTFNAQSA